MLSFTKYLSEAANRADAIKEARAAHPDKKQYKWAGQPNIGWWADKQNVVFYHGTHYSNLLPMLKTGIRAPTSGPTAGWVSLALEPNTAHGYASMGGESGFRAAGAAARTVPPGERVVLVLKMPMSFIEQHMEKDFRGNVTETRDKLTNKAKYEAWKKSDQEYYALTELRFPKVVDPKFIIGFMAK